MNKYNLLIIIYILCSVPFTITAQQIESTTNAYTESLDKREDFWSKVKYFFRPRYKEKPTKPKAKVALPQASSPVLVSNDPNMSQGSRRQYERGIKKLHRENESLNVEQNISQKPKEKKSFKQIVNQLLNGKDYIPEKSYGKKNNVEAKALVKNEQTKVLPNNRQINKTVTTPIYENTITETKKSETKLVIPTQADRNNIKTIEKNVATNKTTPEQKPLPNKIIAETEVDNTIRNEIKPLSLNRTTQGSAGYFYSGMNVGKFYVVTNLANKGEVIKITNTANGKSLMAEVLDILPSADIRKGLLLKISDNAKMPLGQQASIFTVKVNY